jgi:hypothetical protein
MDTENDAFIALLYQIQYENEYETEYDETEDELIPRNLIDDFNNAEPIIPQPEPQRIMVYHLQSSDNEGTFDCPVCWETFDINKRVTTMCDHHYCSSCIETIIKNNIENKRDTQCAMCRNVCTILETLDETAFEKIGELLEENTHYDYSRQNIINQRNNEMNNLLIRRMIYEPYDLPSSIIASDLIQNMRNGRV